MLDQKQANNISKGFGCLFIFFGIAILLIGAPLVFEKNKSDTENTIMVLFLLSGGLMLFGGIQTIKKSIIKNKAIIDYEKQIYIQSRIPEKKADEETKSSQVNLVTTSKSEIKEIGTDEKPYKNSETYKPDILATYKYTLAEWKKMTKEETQRRIKEGIWVSLGIGFLGAWVIKAGEGSTFLIGFIISLAVGIFISVMKVLLSNQLFKSSFDNTIVITTNALIINGKFKTIQDNDIHLQSIKSLKILDDTFLEFSLEWMTRQGVTNDQMRIYVPKQYETELPSILEYYKNKGVQISN